MGKIGKGGIGPPAFVRQRVLFSGTADYLAGLPGLRFEKDVLCYVAVDAFRFHQSYSLVHIAWHWWKRSQLSYVFIWKDACYGCGLCMCPMDRGNGVPRKSKNGSTKRLPLVNSAPHLNNNLQLPRDEVVFLNTTTKCPSIDEKKEKISERYYNSPDGKQSASPMDTRNIRGVTKIARRSPATLSVGLRAANKGSSPPDQNQTRASSTSRSARASKGHQTTTDGAIRADTDPELRLPRGPLELDTW
uniref:SFRICE_020806 n=1 Tax=Spodoptera frugiperda TaxID=7108 RepID=A0A2H1WPG8_SPOFR